MPKQRTGYVWYWKERKSWYARLTFNDASGKRRNICRAVENKTEGNKLLKQLLRDLETEGEKVIDAEKVTFRQLANTYSDRKLIAAEYQGDTKVRGLRSHKIQLGYLKTLIEHFGGLRVRAITHSDLEDYRAKRLQTPSRRGTPLSLASVNRELTLMRSLLNFAKRKGWISRSPFDTGDPLISVADEVKRERVLTFEEEERLLLACYGPREHLRPMLICALDTGLRKSEMLSLRWADMRSHATDDLGNAAYRVLGVARIFALGAVGQKEIALDDEAAFVEDWQHHVARRARIGGAFQDHQLILA